jgi:hypothetical protein
MLELPAFAAIAAFVAELVKPGMIGFYLTVARAAVSWAVRPAVCPSAGTHQIVADRVGHLPERQHRGDRQGRIRVGPGGHAGQQPGRPHVGLRVAQGAELPVPGRRHDDHREGAVVPDEDGVGQIAQIAPRAGRQQSPVEVGGAVAQQPPAKAKEVEPLNGQQAAVQRPSARSAVDGAAGASSAAPDPIA